MVENCFPLRSGTKARMSSLNHLHSPLYWSAQSVQEGRRKNQKGIQIGKEEMKLSLFADNMIFYVENSKDSTRNYD